MGLRASRRAVVAAAAAAFLLRLVFGLFYWVGKPLTHDEREYLSLAESLASGRGFTYSEPEPGGTTQRFGRAPGYPAFLSLLKANNDTDTAPAVVKLVQSALGAMVVVLIAIVAWNASGARAGVAAAVVSAVYPPLVWLSGYVFSESLYMPLVLGCALLLS